MGIYLAIYIILRMFERYYYIVIIILVKIKERVMMMTITSISISVAHTLFLMPNTH
jgi:hypothetical protein